MSKIEIDEKSGVETTGHEWDGIKELNSPLPRWWLWTFYATIVFAIGYMIYYPAWPLLTTSTKGISGETSRGALNKSITLAQKSKTGLIEKIKTSDLTTIANDEQLRRFAVAGGKSAFKVYCSQCHGSGAEGAAGYPNLNDDDWLWGGDLENIYTTIAHGVRFDEDDDTRVSDMPAFGRDELLEKDMIDALAHKIRKLANLDHDSEKAASAEVLYTDNCASCHGDKAKGDVSIGAPNLSDAIWFYGDDIETIKEQIYNPKHGQMPAWKNRLGIVTIKQLAVYVHGLGGGQ